jgi:hypothetical protein
VAALLLACAGTPKLTANVDYKVDHDFGNDKTFEFMPRRGAPAESTILSDMEINRLQKAFLRELLDKGLQLADSPAEADVLVSWLLITQEKTNIRSYNAATAYNCWGCGPSVSDVSIKQYTEGTLIVDVIDQGRNQSVWRGTIQSRIDSSRKAPDPQEQQRYFHEIAATMFERFPP